MVTGDSDDKREIRIDFVITNTFRHSFRCSWFKIPSLTVCYSVTNFQLPSNHVRIFNSISSFLLNRSIEEMQKSHLEEINAMTSRTEAIQTENKNLKVKLADITYDKDQHDLEFNNLKKSYKYVVIGADLISGSRFVRIRLSGFFDYPIRNYLGLYRLFEKCSR